MADVKIVDIDSTQWNIKDQEARNQIATLEKNNSVQELGEIKIKLNNGYTAKEAKMQFGYKIGKINFVQMTLSNISGTNIGTSSTAKIGVIPIKAFRQTSFLAFDYVNGKVARAYINSEGVIALGESNGIVQGSNYIYGELIFVEQ